MSATDATFRETLLKQSIAHFQNQIDRLSALTTHDDETKAAIGIYGEIVTVIAELRTKPAVVVPAAKQKRLTVTQAVKLGRKLVESHIAERFEAHPRVIEATTDGSGGVAITIVVLVDATDIDAAARKEGIL